MRKGGENELFTRHEDEEGKGEDLRRGKRKQTRKWKS